LAAELRTLIQSSPVQLLQTTVLRFDLLHGESSFKPIEGDAVRGQQRMAAARGGQVCLG